MLPNTHTPSLTRLKVSKFQKQQQCGATKTSEKKNESQKKNESEKISKVILQKKSKGSIKRQQFIDRKNDSKKKQNLIRKIHDLRKKPIKNKFNRCPSSKKRLNLIEAKKMFGNTRTGSWIETVKKKGKKLESQIIKEKEKERTFLKKKKKKGKCKKKNPRK